MSNELSLINYFLKSQDIASITRTIEWNCSRDGTYQFEAYIDDYYDGFRGRGDTIEEAILECYKKAGLKRCGWCGAWAKAESCYVATGEPCPPQIDDYHNKHG